MFRGIIYCYTSPSGKKYIGQTRNEKNRRREFLNKMGRYSCENSRIDNARKKYGPENFIYRIIVEIFDEDTKKLIDRLDELEKFFIKEYNTIESGYNSDKGGKSHSRTISDEEKEYRSKRAKEKFKNQPLPDYILKNIEKNKKQILQYSLLGEFIKEWESVASINREFGKVNVSDCATGKREHSKGYIWRYKESENYPLKIEVKLGQHNKNLTKKVIQYDKSGKIIKIFNNVLEMKNELFQNEQIKLVSFWACLKGVNKTFRGYILKYEDTKAWPLINYHQQ